jgi:hypothetical protein
LVENKPAPSAKVAEPKKVMKKISSSGDDPWGAWSDNEEIDIAKVDYNNLNLNKMTDKELNKHKKAMEVEFNKKKIWKDHPEFEYDKRKDFSKLKNNSNEVEEDW